MASSVRYEADGKNAVWPIPFEYSDVSLINVSLVDTLGREIPQAFGRDYYIKDKKVILACSKGCLVLIRLEDAAAPEPSPDDPDTAVIPQEKPATQTAAGMDSLCQAMAGLVRVMAERESAAQALAAAPATLNNADIMVEDERVSQLEARLAAIEEASAKAVEEARESASDAQVSRILEAGASQAASLDEAAEEAARSIEASASQAIGKVEAAGGESGRLAAEALERAREAETKAAETLARLNAALEELQELSLKYAENFVTARDAATARLEARAEKAVANVDKACGHALLRATEQAALPGNAWPQGAAFTQTAHLDCGDYLDVPFAWTAGRHALLVHKNGLIQIEGVDYQEGEADSCGHVTRIKILNPSDAGALWSFWAAPTNAGQEASLCASHALAHANESASHARNVVRMAQDVQAMAEAVEKDGKTLRNSGAQALAEIRSAHSSGLSDVKAASLDGKAGVESMARSRISQINAVADSAIANVSTMSADAGASISRAAAQAKAQVSQTCADHEAQAKAYAEKSGKYAENSRQWAKNSQANAKNALANSHNAAACAEDAYGSAWASQQANRVAGIISVTSLADVGMAASGLYVINPHIQRSPSIFMGVWPVASIADIAWDGVFFIGKPYPDQPAMPPAPEPPDDPPAPPDPDDPAIPDPPQNPGPANSGWIPCGHSHADDRKDEEQENEEAGMEEGGNG